MKQTTKLLCFCFLFFYICCKRNSWHSWRACAFFFFLSYLIIILLQIWAMSLVGCWLFGAGATDRDWKIQQWRLASFLGWDYFLERSGMLAPKWNTFVSTSWSKNQNQSLKYQLVWSHSGSLRIFTRLNELLSSHILARDDFLKLKMSAFLQMLSYPYLFLKSRKGKCHFWLVTLCAWGTIIRDEYLKRKKKVDFLWKSVPVNVAPWLSFGPGRLLESGGVMTQNERGRPFFFSFSLSPPVTPSPF